MVLIDRRGTSRRFDKKGCCLPLVPPYKASVKKGVHGWSEWRRKRVADSNREWSKFVLGSTQETSSVQHCFDRWTEGGSKENFLAYDGMTESVHGQKRTRNSLLAYGGMSQYANRRALEAEFPCGWRHDSVHEQKRTRNRISLNITVSQYTNRRGLETELHCVWRYDSVTTRTEGDSKQFPCVWRYDSVGTRRDGDYKQNFLAYDGTTQYTNRRGLETEFPWI
jgi:hypothetical protein